jgi:transposase
MDRNLPEGSRIIGLDLSKKSFTGCILSGTGFVKKQFFSGKMTQDEQGCELIRSHIHVGDLVLMEAGTSSFSLARYLQQHSAAQDVIRNASGYLDESEEERQV